MNIESEISSNVPTQTQSDYIFIHIDSLSSLFTKLLCSDCKYNSVTSERRKEQGFAFKLVVKCTHCDEMVCEVFSSPKEEKSND